MKTRANCIRIGNDYFERVNKFRYLRFRILENSAALPDTSKRLKERNYYF